MPKEVNNEIISAEIVFSPQNDLSKLPESASEYQQELAAINEKLEKYVNNADRYDYMVAVASGILCGVLDAQVADITKSFLISHEPEIKNKGKEIIIRHLAKKIEEYGETSVEGMAAVILSSCIAIKPEDVITRNEDTGTEELDIRKTIEVYGRNIITCFLEWLTAERKQGEIDESDFPETIKKLLHLLIDYPIIRDFLKDPKIPKIDEGTLENIGVPAFFIALLKPYLGDVNKYLHNATQNANKYSSDVYNNLCKNLHTKLPEKRIDTIFLRKLADQAIGVVANEIIVRGFYFVRHLLVEMQNCENLEQVDWNKVIPFDNRTVTRMMTVASLTFSAADMGIAAVRAALESGGNAAFFAVKYKTNVNVIGVGRAILAVTRDVSMEWEEADLIRERRILTEKCSAEQVEAILAYRSQMEKLVEEYLAEDLQAFLTGAGDIETGIEVNDSDRVIHGNVTIQRVLGRKPQFTNQAEFDALMDSMDDLVM